MNKWLPSRFTPPLSEDFPTAGNTVIQIAETFVRIPERQNEKLKLAEWQKWLLRSILEKYPVNHPDPEKAGRLRYKQVVISIPRKNGKSLLGSILALYGLLAHESGAEVISVASSKDQANIVYRTVLNQILNSPYLKPRFRKTTEFRGIYTSDMTGRYIVMGNRASSAQGSHPSMVIFDELHVGNPDLWTAMNLGSATRKDGIVIGITTAGDDSSLLLNSLYGKGELAIAGNAELERFGFFCWEAPTECALDDRAAVESANPNLVEGLLSWTNIQTELATMPEVDARRYRLNQFVAASNSWLPAGLWQALPHGEVDKTQPVCIAVERTQTWDQASICVAQKTDKGYVTELVANLSRTDKGQLLNLCLKLAGMHQAIFVMDGYLNSELAFELKNRGVNALNMSIKDQVSASNMVFANIVSGKIAHSHDPIITNQMAHAVRKNVGDSWRISRKDSLKDIDGAMATVMAIWGSDQNWNKEPMVH